MNADFENYLLKLTNASGCEEMEVIQSLWSDYGSISRYQLSDSSLKTVVVKYISLDQSSAHPRGWDTDFGHQRKMKSYKIEAHFYEDWSQQCSNKCTVPKCIGEYAMGNEQWIVLEDLDMNFPLRKQELTLAEVKVCLKWLANFHITFLVRKPVGLWETGTYWHLNTRPDEFEKIEHLELKAKAHVIDEILNNCSYQTIVHGDAKLANFCFSENGKQVAAVDFQYVGGGCGIKDVAYFLGSCLSGDECETHEKELLDCYFEELRTAFKDANLNFDFTDLESEWRKMFPIAVTDFTRFLLGWMPSHQKVNNYSMNLMQSVLAGL